MQPTEKTHKKVLPGLVSQFPKGHVAAVSALAVCLAIFSMLPSEKASAKRQVQKLAIPALVHIADIEAPIFQSPPVEPAQAVVTTESLDLKHIFQTVKSGDNLSLIFKRAGLSDRHMMELLESNSESKKLADLYPGHELEFAIDHNNQIQSLKYIKDRLSSFSFVRNESGFEFVKVDRVPDKKYATRAASIKNSLFNAGKDAQLDVKLVMELANIFGWDIDFALDIREGDNFKVLYEESFLDGEKIGTGNILAAEFVNQGHTFSAVRYTDESGESNYYTPAGESMRKAFLRAPLDFRRISSNFNPRRLHPVLKTVRPHRGIDYAANVGTPVWASGDGRVIASGYTSANGNYIVIQHGNGIQTKYLHLSKRYVKKGQRVRQKQRIGNVGATGLANGPHLHYEFLINGVHRNPRTVVQKLPKAKAVEAGEMNRFLAQTQTVLAQLNPQPATTKYASSEPADTGSAKKL